MKWVRFGLASLFVLGLASAAIADDKATTKSADTKTMTKGHMSSDEMADKAMAKWKGVLKLTPDQEPKFEAALKDSYSKMADAKKAANGDQTKMKASMQQIMTDRDAAIGQILTPDQMKIYQEKVKEKTAQAKKHWDNKNAAAGKDKDKAAATGK